ncbi:MAG: penicillin acylase family protein [Paracoccaceae bacterium]
MATLFRWLLRLFSTLVVLLFLGVGIVYWLGLRSIPDYDTSFEVGGLSGPVEIVRDHANVPHIFAQANEDVFFGLGFVHAQDRMWQMMMMRRTAQGRLSEIFGERTVSVDELLRRLDIYRLSVSSVQALDEQTMEALTAYSAGVNAWLSQVNLGSLGRGAPEFFLFSNQIATWQPADSIAIAKLMALQLASHLDEEVLLARTSLMLPAARVLDIMPDAPGNPISALPEYSGLFPTAPRYVSLPQQAQHPLSPFHRKPLAGASNAWAAAPSRSATGSTLLANDPHLGFSAPSVWYLSRLELSSGGVIGATIPGIPTIMVGRSNQLGWGLTSAYVDDQDVLIEKLNPDNPTEVLTPEGYKPLRTRTSIIKIKGATPKTITLQWSDNGPILPGSHYNLAAITPPGHVASVAWTVLDSADTSMTYGQRIMTAQSVKEALAAGAYYVAPSQNLTVVDRETIAMKTIGRIPRRTAQHKSFGRLPVPGWQAQNQWQGFTNYTSNPEFMSPKGGILGNTNNKTVDRPFPFHVSFLWGDTQRVQRWKKLMQNREVHTRDSFIEAQLDTVSFTARSLLPLIAANLWFTGDTAAEGTTARLRQRALALLAQWNGEMSEHLPEPLIYAAWLRALQTRLIQDDLGPLSSEFSHVEPVFIERVYRDIDGAGAWCDVSQSAPVETCTDIARQSLDDALLWITENHAGTLESLRWGDAHEATHDHAVLGDVPLLKFFVNIRQSTSGGDNTLQRGRTSGKDPKPFLNVHGAGYRGVYDFADPDSSVFVISTGQSGHPLSRHYDDLGELWRRGEYIPMSLDPDLARAAAVGITHLQPSPKATPSN